MTNFNDSGSKVISPSKLAHVVLRTKSLDAMGKFYIDFLGGRTAIDVPNMLHFITYDDEHHRIGLVGIPDLEDKVVKSNGLEHFAFTFPTIDALFLAYRQRKARGIIPFWCTNHGPTLSIYYKDPDGNIVETQYDNFKTVGEADEFMRGEEYKVNPIGVDFDPEKMIERIESGEALKSLIKRPDIGPRGIDTVP